MNEKEMLTDIHTLVECLDGVLDDLFDICSSRNEEADGIVNAMKEKYQKKWVEV